VLEPVSVALKFGFLAVLYLFLLWIARSALKDLRRGEAREALGGERASGDHYEATGIHSATAGIVPQSDEEEPYLYVESAPGHRPGSAFQLGDEAIFGRGDGVDIRLEDPYASTNHARITRRGDVLVLEDLGSTNGTYLNEEPVQGPRPLHPGDRIRIGSSEFSFQL
jgi:hypothetical protein